MQLDKDPIRQFRQDWERVRALRDPLAPLCLLASVDSHGRPTVRTVVLWDAFVIITNSTSPKWRQLESSPAFEIAVLWTSIQRQYRVRGVAEALSAEELSGFWQRTRHELKLLDHYYNRYEAQSEGLGMWPQGTDLMLKRMEALKAEYPDRDKVPMPETSRGLRLNAQEIDLWDGNSPCPNRVLFSRSGNGWICTSLVP